MHPFYPPIKAYAQHRMPVSDLHNLYLEECGNPEGVPILVLHNGPGNGCEGYHRRFFDPDVYRIILFDQRGAGRSTPHTEIRENTLPDLIKDIEAIRSFLKIPRWVVFGGSWGSLLALYYAEHFPQAVSGMILHSIFLGRRADIDWIYREGTNKIFPDYWDEFVKSFSADEQTNIIEAYQQRLQSSDEITRMSTAKNWAAWQARCSSLQPHNALLEQYSDPHLALGLAYLETHYLSHHCFLGDYAILTHSNKISGIPGFIIHGRYNMMSPVKNAYALHHAWPSSELYIIRDAGHADTEPGIIDAIVLASQKMAKSEIEFRA